MGKLPILLEGFLAFGEGTVGCGPDHPTTPRQDLASVAANLFQKYPGLLNDPSYVEFLRTYGGATVTVNEADGSERWVAFLIGLDDFNGQVVRFDEEGYEVGEDGWFCFAQLYHQRSRVEPIFVYYAHDSSHPGVYLETSKGCEWYCESFSHWLQHMVSSGEAIFSEIGADT